MFIKRVIVRITLDKDIYSTDKVRLFLDKNKPNKLPVLPLGYFILEVKYDEFLPQHIYKALGIKHLNQTAFSKFYMAKTMSKQSFIHKGVTNYDIQ